MPNDSIDPRYNPAFQRGYDRSRHGTEPHLRAAEPVVERIPREVKRVTPTAAVVPPSVADASSGPARSPERPQALLAEGVPDASDTDAAHDTGPGMVLRGNPFIIVLLVVGAALAVFGIWAQWQIADLFTGASSADPDNFILQQFLVGIGPWCMTIGIATLVTVLVLYAINWKAPRTAA